MIDWWHSLSDGTHHIIYIAIASAVVIETVAQIVAHKRRHRKRWPHVD